MTKGERASLSEASLPSIVRKPERAGWPQGKKKRERERGGERENKKQKHTQTHTHTHTQLAYFGRDAQMSEMLLNDGPGIET